MAPYLARTRNTYTDIRICSFYHTCYKYMHYWWWVGTMWRKPPQIFYTKTVWSTLKCEGGHRELPPLRTDCWLTVKTNRWQHLVIYMMFWQHLVIYMMFCCCPCTAAEMLLHPIKEKTCLIQGSNSSPSSLFTLDHKDCIILVHCLCYYKGASSEPKADYKSTITPQSTTRKQTKLWLLFGLELISLQTFLDAFAVRVLFDWICY